MSQTWAYISNYFIYSAMAVYTLSFFAHAYETAWAVRAPQSSDSTDGNLITKTLDYTRTEKAARIATAMMILGFILLFAGVIARGISAHRVPWGNMYEFSITGALAFTGAYLGALRKYDLRWLGLLVSIAVLLTLGTAVADFLPARTFSPIEPVILSALSSTPSKVSYNFKSLAAVFSPTPGIPGILSEASPIKPNISTTCSTLAISHFSQIFLASTISSLLPNAGGFHIYTLGFTSN